MAIDVLERDDLPFPRSLPVLAPGDVVIVSIFTGYLRGWPWLNSLERDVLHPAPARLYRDAVLLISSLRPICRTGGEVEHRRSKRRVLPWDTDEGDPPTGPSRRAARYGRVWNRVRRPGAAGCDCRPPIGDAPRSSVRVCAHFEGSRRRDYRRH